MIRRLRLRSCVVAMTGLAIIVACDQSGGPAHTPDISGRSASVAQSASAPGELRGYPRSRNSFPADSREEAGRTTDWLTAAGFHHRPLQEVFGSFEEYEAAFPDATLIIIDFERTIYEVSPGGVVEIERAALTERARRAAGSDILLVWHEVALREYVYEAMWRLHDAGVVPRTSFRRNE